MIPHGVSDRHHAQVPFLGFPESHVKEFLQAEGMNIVYKIVRELHYGDLQLPQKISPVATLQFDSVCSQSFHVEAIPLVFVGM